MPEEERPDCATCDNVPKVSIENEKIILVYLSLLTLSVEPELGLVKYDPGIVRELCRAVRLDIEDQPFVSVLLLCMVSHTNALRMKKQSEAIAKDKTEGRYNARNRATATVE